MSGQSNDPLLDNALDAISALVNNNNGANKKAFKEALVAASDHEELYEVDNYLDRYINKLITKQELKRNSDLHRYLEKTIQDTFEPIHTKNYNDMEGGKKPRKSRKPRKSKKNRKSNKNRKSRKTRKTRKSKK
jgi:hypothetical protein